MKKWSYLKFLLFFLLLANEKIKAQPFNLDERIVPAELQFEDFKKEGEDKANGRISINKLVQENDTSYYFIKGLNMYSPTYFSLNSADAGADITVNLCKENWHEVRHTGEVKGKSIWKTNFKTEGDFGIMVVAKKKPASYVLLVWTGNEMKVDMPSVFKNGTDGTGSNNSSGWFKKNMTVIIVAVVALLIIAFLLIKLKKKKSMKKVILVLSAMFLSYALTAQDDDLSLGGDNDPAEAVNEAYENLQGYMDWLEERRNEWNTVQNFSPGECSPDFNASSGAMMNSTCANNAACSECYEKAVGELNFIRRQLGRLSCIYSNTKNFNESALAFGDNMSGIHAVTGIAWQNERGGIIAEFNHFKQTYDSKYTDMMGALQRALQGIGTCEQQYGLPDWYQRFGFIYFEFMKDKYKRTD